LAATRIIGGPCLARGRRGGYLRRHCNENRISIFLTMKQDSPHPVVLLDPEALKANAVNDGPPRPAHEKQECPQPPIPEFEIASVRPLVRGQAGVKQLLHLFEMEVINSGLILNSQLHLLRRILIDPSAIQRMSGDVRA
jgi:hypothetical protein